ncbi:PaaI family thioesterase [Streptomyces sp. NPDC059382]|uniref:PaaI family thioesterase n=1 Tax=unclassified Streptomyces TaxID=2593676 RepID=UPI00332734CD
MTSHETTDPAPAPSRTHDGQPGPEAPEPHGLSGLDMLRATLKGTLPDASIMNTMSFRLTDVAEGFVAFEGDPGDHLLNYMGTVHGGFLATLLDSALGSSVMTRLPAGTTYATVQLGIHLIRPVLADTPTLRCEGTALHVGRTTATAEARVIGTHDGKLYAHGTTTCAILRP